jgi:hypothetical protein
VHVDAGVVHRLPLLRIGQAVLAAGQVRVAGEVELARLQPLLQHRDVVALREPAAVIADQLLSSSGSLPMMSCSRVTHPAD